MVLFDEDPVVLIAETTNQFHIAPDRDALARISNSLSTLQQARTLRIENHSHTLKQLSRRLNNLQSAQNFEEERHDAGKHASEMLRMDTEKFRVAKTASEAEIEAERLQGELAGLQAQLQTLEREGVEGGRRGREGEEDELVLKLQFYRSLGIDIDQDPVTGIPERAIARNISRGDVSVVHLDASASRASIANALWDGL